MRQVLVASPFIVIFTLLGIGSITAAVLNLKRYQQVKSRPPIPLDLTAPLPSGTGFPWSPKFRGQPWPDPNAEQLTVESARRYAGAAERRARSCLLMGDAAIFILAIPSGLFAPVLIQRWPNPPPDSVWVWIGLVMASMIGGISLKVYAAPYWEAARDAYIEAVERLTAEQQRAAPSPERRRGVSERARAALREFFD